MAELMIRKGVNPPKPKTEVELLASEISSALREETRYDGKTGLPYRANHAVPTQQGVLWIDIDEKPTRSIMQKSLMKRRDQMVADGLHLTLDADHWNSENPDQEPIKIPLVFELDVEIEKAKKLVILSGDKLPELNVEIEKSKKKWINPLSSRWH